MTEGVSHDARTEGRVRFAPGVEELRAVGASSLDDLFAPERLETFARADQLASRAGDVVLRLPLPGTPDADGRVHEAPRGAGTGHVILRVYRTPVGKGLRARLSHPRSASLAERDWNVACHLRSAGVATPDLVLVGARGHGLFSRESVLVTRELARMEPFDRWTRRPDRADEERRLGLEAVARALSRLERSGAVLPELEASDVFVQTAPGTCGATAPPPATGPAGAEPGEARVRKLPGVAFANLRGGFLARSRGRRSAERLRADLEGLLEPGERARLARRV